MSAWLSRIRRVFFKPLFGTVPIPRDTRVDPSQFPETEFPLHCPCCGYLLRGVPDGPCPECGTPFERSLRIVQQYVREPWSVHQYPTRFARFARGVSRATWMTWAVVLGSVLALGGLGWLYPDTYKGLALSWTAGGTRLGRVLNLAPVLFLTVVGALYGLLIASALLNLHFHVKHSKKRRRVVDEIKQASRDAAPRPDR
jgi:hypothetical protein